MRKKILIICSTILFIFVLFGCSKDSGSKPIKVNQDSPLNTVTSFIRVYYFDEGNYDNYKQLFAKQDNINKEVKFNEYRKNNNPGTVFPSDYDTIEKVVKHLKVKNIDNNNAEVHWISDINKDFSDSKMYWIVTKRDGKWYLQ